MEHTRRLLRAFFDLSQAHRGTYVSDLPQTWQLQLTTHLNVCHKHTEVRTSQTYHRLDNYNSLHTLAFVTSTQGIVHLRPTTDLPLLLHHNFCLQLTLLITTAQTYHRLDNYNSLQTLAFVTDTQRYVRLRPITDLPLLLHHNWCLQLTLLITTAEFFCSLMCCVSCCSVEYLPLQLVSSGMFQLSCCVNSVAV